ncbi:cysteine-rich receptor-like protein kinase [Trifolium medium]|uniref:Cysteine-rich receptor-like protein kinase n=1 Tax=Trifolium medium TaxID=97028 RepID=A0A392Q4J7_9FABA|nr:cysteine-rich receptor-like protein kinase [Trifolium medium]
MELKEDFFSFMNDFHMNGKLVKGLNNTFIALIPKKDNPANLNDFRPISLVGSIYKVLSKVLANRMKKFLPKLIDETQSAFVQGRQILDGVLIANEVIDEAKRKKRDVLLFKVVFKLTSGLKVNFHKSELMGIHVQPQWLKDAA